MHITQTETEVLINNGSILTSIISFPLCIASIQFFDTEIKYKLKVKKHPMNQSVWRKCAVYNLLKKPYTYKTRIYKRKDVHNLKEKLSSKILSSIQVSKISTKKNH